MKTKERNVIVEVKVGESKRHRRISYPITDGDGNLMTNRLRRLIAGKLGRSESEEEREIQGISQAKRQKALPEQEGDPDPVPGRAGRGHRGHPAVPL